MSGFGVAIERLTRPERKFNGLRMQIRTGLAASRDSSEMSL